MPRGGSRTRRTLWNALRRHALLVRRFAWGVFRNTYRCRTCHGHKYTVCVRKKIRKSIRTFLEFRLLRLEIRAPTQTSRADPRHVNDNQDQFRCVLDAFSGLEQSRPVETSQVSVQGTAALGESRGPGSLVGSRGLYLAENKDRSGPVG